MPHCPGAINGKYGTITQPPKSYSIFFNYRKFFIVLLVVADANNKFLHVEIGREGSATDTQTFNESEPNAYIENDNT